MFAIALEVLLLGRLILGSGWASLAAAGGTLAVRLDYTAGQYLDTLPKCSVCRINILDKILITGEYFKRFRSCGIEKQMSYTAGHSAIDLLDLSNVERQCPTGRDLQPLRFQRDGSGAEFESRHGAPNPRPNAFVRRAQRGHK